MLRPRIIPTLLLRNKGLVKTVNFSSEKYVGDPINAIRIFNEKECDELMILDIDSSSKRSDIDISSIRKFAAECRMPLCYGGGIKTIDQANKIISLGVEKIAISSAAIENPSLVKELAYEIGSQSVVVVLDVKRTAFGKYKIFTHNGTKATGKEVVSTAKIFQELGAGEIVINSIDQDGLMKGYDLKLAKLISASLSLPKTILGGAGDYNDFNKLVGECGIIGCAAGSLFVFKGVYRAVLISYPDQLIKDDVASKLGK